MSYLPTDYPDSPLVIGTQSAYRLTDPLSPELNTELESEFFQEGLSAQSFLDESEEIISLPKIEGDISPPAVDKVLSTPETDENDDFSTASAPGESANLAGGIPELDDESALEAAADRLLATAPDNDEWERDYEFNEQMDDPVAEISESGIFLPQGNFLPTDEPPGSPGKVEVLRYRYHHGLPLWHEHDRIDFAGLGFLSYLQQDESEDSRRENVETLEPEYEERERAREKVHKPRAGGKHKLKREHPARVEQKSDQAADTVVAADQAPPVAHFETSDQIEFHTETDSGMSPQSDASPRTSIAEEIALKSTSTETSGADFPALVGISPVEAAEIHAPSDIKEEPARIQAELSLSNATLPALTDIRSDIPAELEVDIAQTGSPVTISVPPDNQLSDAFTQKATSAAVAGCATPSISAPQVAILAPEIRRIYESFRSCVVSGGIRQSDLDAFRRAHKITAEMDALMFGSGDSVAPRQ